MAFQLVIFDCDGTLVDSEYLNNLATCELLAAEGLHEYDLDYAYEHFVGMRFSQILRNITAETGHVFPADFVQRYVARAHALIPTHLRPVEGATELVRAAMARGKIAVASNGQRDNVLASLHHAGLLDHFPAGTILTGTDIENPKPAPDIFLRTAQNLGATPARCLVIEDSVPGAIAGLAAGMDVRGFTGVHHDPDPYAEKLKNAGVTNVYNSLHTLRAEVLG